MIKQEVTKITEQELNEIQELQKKQNVYITSLGTAEYQLNFYEKQKDQIIDQLEEIDIKIKKLSDDLKEKYGDVVISTDTGEIVNE